LERKLREKRIMGDIMVFEDDIRQAKEKDLDNQ
jgi:hypothetical protein